MTEHDAESLEQVIAEQAREIARLRDERARWVAAQAEAVHAATAHMADEIARLRALRVCARCREAFAIEDLKAHGELTAPPAGG